MPRNTDFKPGDEVSGTVLNDKGGVKQIRGFVKEVGSGWIRVKYVDFSEGEFDPSHFSKVEE